MRGLKIKSPSPGDKNDDKLNKIRWLEVIMNTTYSNAIGIEIFGIPWNFIWIWIWT